VGGTEKKARRERRTLIFVDESGFYLLPAVVGTYAPCGQTPVLRPVLTRAHLSVMGAVTATGGLYTLVRKAALTGQASRIPAASAAPCGRETVGHLGWRLDPLGD
jgi:hypothetical protein